MVGSLTVTTESDRDCYFLQLLLGRVQRKAVSDFCKEKSLRVFSTFIEDEDEDEDPFNLALAHSFVFSSLFGTIEVVQSCTWIFYGRCIFARGRAVLNRGCGEPGGGIGRADLAEFEGRRWPSGVRNALEMFIDFYRLRVAASRIGAPGPGG